MWEAKARSFVAALALQLLAESRLASSKLSRVFTQLSPLEGPCKVVIYELKYRSLLSRFSVSPRL